MDKSFVWFSSELRDESQVKLEFQRLALMYHPSLPNGDSDKFKGIYAEYLAKLASIHGSTSTTATGKELKYQFDRDVESALVDKISALLDLRMIGVKIALVGTWIWVTGETRAYSDKLNRKMGLGLNWSPDKSAWYFHTGPFRKRGRRPVSWEYIKNRYGYQEINR